MTVILLLLFVVSLGVLLAGAIGSEQSNPIAMIAAALMLAASAGVIGFTLGDVRAAYTSENAGRVIRLTNDRLTEGKIKEVEEAFRNAAAARGSELTELHQALRSISSQPTP